MLLHILTVYSVISLAIMEIAMGHLVGTQPHPLQRASFYIGGLILGPVAALIGIIIGIIKWDLRGR